jgi:hypothetical protein
VARWYVDVESDLLADAARRDCPFAAVVAEGNARVARYTYYGTKVEHDLARHGIELFMVEEGINLEGGKATKVLMRRVNHAISEWHALNVLELAWDGMRVHTTEGYNTGRATYGYLPVAEPHPATVRTYLLRGLIRCGICGHRMQGTQRYGDRIYYRCTGPRNTAGKPTRPDHPGSLYIREDILLPALTELIATRVFGPHRHRHLAHHPRGRHRDHRGHEHDRRLP